MNDPADTLALVLKSKPGAELRAGQQEMCTAVAAALRSGRHLLVEAPTGTGKSLAYAVAAVLHTHGNDDARVVITTATKALQEQLCDEDLPFVQAALREQGIDFSFSLLKGRANYLCAAKLDELDGGTGGSTPGMFESRTATEAARGDAMGRVRDWAKHSDTGDRAELTDDVADDIWQSVSTSARDCPGVQACPAGERCYAEKARARAQESDVVVVNTALYGAHLAAFRQVLPEHDVVVVDEAHLSEDVFADQFGFDISGGRLRNLAALAQPLVGAEPAIERLRMQALRLDDLWTRLSKRDDARVRACEGEPAEVLDAVRTAVSDVVRALKDATPERSSPSATRKARADKAAQALAMEVGLALAPEVYEAHVAWCEVDRGNPRLIVMPVVVGELLSERLHPHATVVATSATLTVGGTFDVTAERLGFGDTWDGKRVASPFEFREQAMLYVPRHLPEPRSERYAEAMATELHDLIVAAGGRTLALFTSWKAMQATAEACKGHGTYRVLCQGESPRRTLVDALRDNAAEGGVAVFATMGFWTGVDVPGLGLSLVAIDRIPFPRPTEPLHAARRDRAARAGLDPFHAVDVPRAALLLAQGTGRLIRHRDDRGVVAVLDRRLATAGYRRALLASLAPFKRTVDREEVHRFLHEITH